MNPSAKTIALWVVLLITAVLLYNVFTRPQNTKETEMNFSRFMDDVNNKQVRSVRIVDSTLTGQLVSGETFKTVIPASYPELFDKLQGVDVKIENSTPNPWMAALVSWAPFLFIVVLWIYFRRFLRKKVSTGPTSGDGNLIQLDPDVAKEFSNAQAVNAALRLVIQLKNGHTA